MKIYVAVTDRFVVEGPHVDFSVDSVDIGETAVGDQLMGGQTYADRARGGCLLVGVHFYSCSSG